MCRSSQSSAVRHHTKPHQVPHNHQRVQQPVRETFYFNLCSTSFMHMQQRTPLCISNIKYKTILIFDKKNTALFIM